MGMQVAFLQAGSSYAAPIQREQKTTTQPIEREETAAKDSHHLSGDEKPQAQNLRQTVSDLEKISLAFDRRLQFIVDQESKELIVKVIDNETDQVIRVLPPEELQRLHSRLRETMGFLFDGVV